MNVTPRIPTEDRARVAKRYDGGTSVIVAASLQTPSDLAYAIRFLTDHYTYKRSKSLGYVNQEAAADAKAALDAAAETFSQEVQGSEGPQPVIPPVSPIAEGTVGNPWDNVQG